MFKLNSNNGGGWRVSPFVPVVASPPMAGTTGQNIAVIPPAQNAIHSFPFKVGGNFDTFLYPDYVPQNKALFSKMYLRLEMGVESDSTPADYTEDREPILKKLLIRQREQFISIRLIADRCFGFILLLPVSLIAVVLDNVVRVSRV
jgi:hypothetical protein